MCRVGKCEEVRVVESLQQQAKKKWKLVLALNLNYNRRAAGAGASDGKGKDGNIDAYISGTDSPTGLVDNTFA